jgi:hypothetical protein
MCRQALLEYEIFQKSPIRVLMASENGRIWIAPSATSLLLCTLIINIFYRGKNNVTPAKAGRYKHSPFKLSSK